MNCSLGNFFEPFLSTYGGDARYEQYKCIVSRICGHDCEVPDTRDGRLERGEFPIKVDWPLAVCNNTSQ